MSASPIFLIRPVSDASFWTSAAIKHRRIDGYLKGPEGFTRDLTHDAIKARELIERKTGHACGLYALSWREVRSRHKPDILAAHIGTLAVLPAHRHKTYGKQLMMHAMASALAASEHFPLSMVTLDPIADSATSIKKLEAFYASLGFSPFGDGPQWHIPIAKISAFTP